MRQQMVGCSADNETFFKTLKQNLKVKELCKARIIAVSYKNIKEPKIGLTMRQPYLGALSWTKEAKKKK